MSAPKLAVIAVVAVIALCAGAAADDRPPRKVDLYGDPLPEGAIARMGTAQPRHKNPVVAFSEDGKTLITVDEEVVYRRDVATGKELGQQRLAFPQPKVGNRRVLEISPNGKLLAVGFDDVVALYDVATGKERYRLDVRAGSKARCIFAPTGAALATIEDYELESPRVQICDSATGKLNSSLPHGTHQWSGCAFSPDRQYFATTDYRSNRLVLWDVKTGEKLREQEVIESYVEFAPDGKTLAVGGNNGVTLFETGTLKQVAHWRPPDNPPITSMRFSPDGASLLCGRQMGDMLVWDVATRKEKTHLDALHVDRLRFSPDGKTLAVWGYFAPMVELWDVASGKRLASRPTHQQFVQSLAVASDGKTVASGAYHDPMARLWDAASGKELLEIRSADSAVHAVALSARGTMIATGGSQGTLQVWEIATGKELMRLTIDPARGNQHSVQLLAFSPDGTRLSAVSVGLGARSADGLIRVWDMAAGRLAAERPVRVEVFRRTMPGGGTGMSFQPHFAIAPERDFLTVRDNLRLFVEDVRTGREVVSVGTGFGAPLAFSPDGRLIAVSRYKPGQDPYEGEVAEAVELVEAATGRRVQELDMPQGGSLAFSRDGRFLLSAGATMGIWEVVSGKQVFRRGPVGGASGWLGQFVLGGRAVVTGGYDGTLLVWDVAVDTWPRRVKAGALTREETKRLWDDLATAGPNALKAIHALVDAPADSLTLLKASLKSATAIDVKEVERRIALLSDTQFATRDRASRELLQMRDEIDSILKTWLNKSLPVESRRRIKELLAAPPPAPANEALRNLRAVEVLERIGTEDAKTLLRELSAGAPEARLTREAKASLVRLERRP